MGVRGSGARGRRRRGAEGWAAASGQEYLWVRTGSGRSPDLRDMVRVPGLGPELRGAIGVGREAFAAAAFGRDVGVLEHELLVQALLEEVDAGAVDQRQAVGIDEDAHAVLLEHGVAVTLLAGQVGQVAPARARSEEHTAELQSLMSI